MQLVLTGLKRMEIRSLERPVPETGMIRLKVRYCGVCRTDAKMWHEGHRDLVFPRVPGHELVAEDDQGQRYTVWPGRVCGRCRFCTTDRENLCDAMRIMGFHFDGGFGDHVLAPIDSLIPVPDDIESPRVCFTEPVGCVLNALEKIDLQADQRVIVYGGGTVGLIAALTVKTQGGIPVVIEKNAQKIAKAAPFLATTRIACRQETTESAFDAVLNACPDPIAFSQGIAKLAKGGRFAFFSGLAKNQTIETNLLNRVHYSEGGLIGSYGLTRRHLRAALGIIGDYPAAFDGLVEALVRPEEVVERLPRVLAGESFKVIIDFSDTVGTAAERSQIRPAPCPTTAAEQSSTRKIGLFERTRRTVTPVAADLLPAARQKIDNKTKPLGALGRLEALAVQLSLIQRRLTPHIENKALLVFAADHGITEAGVSAYPASVTAQMVKNFLDGGAAINVLCRHHDIEMGIVDMGVDAELPPHARLMDKKVRRGTRNFALEPAMTGEEAIQAIEAGMTCVFDLHTRRPLHIIGLGEMGIGNTTAASAIISAATGMPPEEATGRGTGVDDAGLRHKAAVIRKALAFQRPEATDGLDILCKVGGYEIAGIVGAALAAASVGAAVVLDGVISTAAGLIAFLIQPDITGYLISGHRSVEAAQTAALEKMGLTPVLDLDMRLGEGTGAALTIDIVGAACRIMREMASFDEAGVSRCK